MSRTSLVASIFAVVGTVSVALGVAVAAVAAFQDGGEPLTISGVVSDAEGPLAGATVQIQASPETVQTDDSGVFSISAPANSTPITVTAWSEGYYIGWTTLDPAASDGMDSDNVSIELRPIPQGDHSEYEWFEQEGVEGSAACGLCHREYPEWQADAHSQSATNHRFLTMYTGMNVAGEQNQMTQYGVEGALPPDPSVPYYGPGWMLDNPGRAGNCATCHTPAASTISNQQNCAWSGCHTYLTIERARGLIDQPVMPLNLRGDEAEGISCEFCHKIGDVYLDPETQLPYAAMPGVLSLRLHRPSEESEQVFFGPLVDVTRPDSYLPLQSESEFCAACHFGVFDGVAGDMDVTGGEVIYNSYGEWLESPYSDRETGRTCQDCHMARSNENWFVYPERGGHERDYVELHDHTMLGITHETMMQNAVTMESSAQRNGDSLEVEVSITNDLTGHHVPTDAPIRSMILVVEAVGTDGEALTLIEGPVNPDWSGNFGGLPGRTFAKVLRDDWTGDTPTAAFWRPVTLVEDTRLAAMATDTTRYTFDAPAGEAVTVNVRLVYRRAFYELMQQKGWDDPDMLMEEATIEVEG